MCDAAALARSAEVTRAAAVQRTRQVGRTGQGRGPPHLLLKSIPKERLMAREWHGRLELAVGKMLQPFGHSCDAYIFFDQIVIRRDIAVTERPIFAVTILGGGFEIRFAEAQTYAPPDISAATRHAKAAHPIEGLVFRSCVWFLEIIDEPVIVVLTANVEFGLNWARLANNFRRAIAVLQ